MESLSGVDDNGRIVVVYERVSTDRQDLTRQAVQRERAAADNPTREVVVIQDDGVSAFKVPIFDRPGGRRLCELVAAGRVEAIYADAQDRLSRGDDVEWVTFRAACESQGTRLVIDGRELRSDLSGRLEGYLKAILARQESLEKSHRTRSGKAAKARQGQRNGGPRPYGYRQQDGALTLDRHEAEVLRRIRADVVAGRSMSEIARDLNRDGITTTRGSKWSQTRISQMLANRLYLGKVKYLDTEYDGAHEPVFSDDEWDEVQAVLSARRRGPGNGRGRQPHFHLMSRGMLRCGCCGEAIAPRRTTNTQGKVYELYRCLGQLGGSSPDCTMPTLTREAVDGAILDYFAESCLDVERTRERIAEQIDRALAETRTALTEAERQRAVADDRLARVKRDYQDGRLDAEDWSEQRDDLRAERDAAVAQVDRLTRRADEIESEGASLDAEEQVLLHLAELRAAVSGQVTDAQGVEGVRAALLRLFSGFTLHSFDAPEVSPRLPEGWVRSKLYTHPRLLVAGSGGFVIEPHPRAEVILSGDTHAAFPELRRVALDARVSLQASAPQ